MIVAAVLLAFQAAPAPGPASGIAGVIRTAEDGRILRGVLVGMAGSSRWTVSDSLGQYALTDLRPGSYRLRFVSIGRLPAEIVALVPEGAVVRLDIELSPRAASLAPLVVTVRRERGSGTLDEIGALRPAASGEPVPGPGELQNVLSNLPGTATRGDGSGTLIFQGGESDQAGILVDGFPVLGATHFGSALSALNPDLIHGIEVRTGAPPARFGGWLSGTVLLESSLLSQDSSRGRGGINPTDARQLLRGALPGGAGRFLLSGRRSFRNVWGESSLPESGNGYEDWLGSAALPLGPGRLRLLLLGSRNHLGFPSSAEADVTAARAPGNNLEWQNSTVGVAWETGGFLRGTLGLRAWRAATGAVVEWGSANDAIALQSGFTQLGLRADGSIPQPAGRVEFGIGVTSDRSGYQSGRPGAPASLAVAVQSTLATGYLERSWRLGAFSARLGTRADLSGQGWLGFEPRAGVEVRPVRWLRAALDAGRIFQFSQSLRNQESFLSSIVAFDLPAGVGAAGLPVSSADNVSLTVEAFPGSGTTIGLRGYARRFQGLLLAAGSTAQPFVTTTLSRGTGTASGAEVRFTHIQGPFVVDASLAMARALRRVGSDVRYNPGFLRTRSLSIRISASPDSQSVVGLALLAGNGQPTTLVRDIGWRPYDPFSGGELLGTPDNLEPGINQRRLPGMARLDFGASRRFRLPPWLSRASLTASLAIDNLLNRHNPLAVTASAATGAPLTLFARPRTLRLELGWRF